MEYDDHKKSGCACVIGVCTIIAILLALSVSTLLLYNQLLSTRDRLTELELMVSDALSNHIIQVSGHQLGLDYYSGGEGIGCLVLGSLHR